MKPGKYSRKIHKIIQLFTINDFILIVLILITALFLFVTSLKEDTQIVEIRYQNKSFGKYPMQKSQIIEVSDGIIVEIADRKVRIKKNTCPNQLCVEQGWTDNFPIICVPNQVEIVIHSDKKTNKKQIRHILK